MVVVGGGAAGLSAALALGRARRRCGQPLGVLGTLPGSVDHALLVRQWSSDVVFFTHTYELSDAERIGLEARGVQIVPGEIARLVVEDDPLTGVGRRRVPAVLRRASRDAKLAETIASCARFASRWQLRPTSKHPNRRSTEP